MVIEVLSNKKRNSRLTVPHYNHNLPVCHGFQILLYGASTYYEAYVDTNVDNNYMSNVVKYSVTEAKEIEDDCNDD